MASDFGQPGDSALPGGRTLIGATLGELIIQSELGRGGMGTVYVAWQPSLRRRVAVKVLHSALVFTETAVIRFQREAQAAARLNHPCIVPIFGQGVQGEIHYYVMEMVQGRNLRRVLDEWRGAPVPSGGSGSDETVIISNVGRSRTAAAESQAVLAQTQLLVPPPAPTAKPDSSATLPACAQDYDRIVELMAGIADALDYAHRQGVIHRDIKPHNLILADNGRLCITDFGLARLAAEPGVTTTGEFVGSPMYMSPEQIRGPGDKVDHRADIYALGATLYEWLTLQPVCPAETREQVITQILTRDPIPARVHDRRIPLDLETICLKALEKDPNRRYQHAGEMRDDLLAFLKRHQIRARRDGFMTRSVRRVKEHPIGSLAAAASVLVIILAAVLVNKELRSKHTKQQVATLQSKIADSETEREALAEQVNSLKQMLDVGLQLGQTLGQQPQVPKLFPGNKEVELPDTEAELARRVVPYLLSRYIQQMTKGRSVENVGEAGGAYFKAILGGDRERAWSLLRPVLETNPEDYSARYLRAILACERSRFQVMFNDSDQLVRQRPRAVQGYFLRGLANLFARRLPAAASDFDRVYEMGLKDAWVLTAKGALCCRQDQLEPALVELNQALSENPGEPAALIARSEALSRSKQHASAILDLTEVINLDPENHRAYALRAREYEAVNDLDSAVADLGLAFNLTGNLKLGAEFLGLKQKLRNKSGVSGAALPNPPDAEVPTPPKDLSVPPAPGTGKIP